MSVGLPILTYTITFACNETSGCPAPSLLHPWSFRLDTLADEIGWFGRNTIFNFKTVIATLGYYALLFFLYGILPALEVEGTELRNGHRIKYRFNGKSLEV